MEVLTSGRLARRPGMAILDNPPNHLGQEAFIDT